MDRARLALLAVCALLTTTIDPPLIDRDRPLLAETESALHTEAELPAVSSPPPNAEEDVAIQAMLADPELAAAQAPAPISDAEIIAAILRRLSVRHTALPEHERIALAFTIVREARAQGLEPDLVIAVIEVESAGYHLAVSHVGAMGLMQLLPATGKELAGKHGVEWKGPDTLFDPTINVKLGTAYLRQLANKYDGDVSIALAAYNWGPGRIDRRLRRGDSVPSRYIEQVMRAYDRYDGPSSRRS